MLGSSSCELRFSSRVRRDRVGPFALAPGRLPWGLVPLRGVNPASPHPDEHPGSPSFRPQRFARSRRLTPRCTLQVCFALLPRPGFRSGVPPPTQRYHLVGGPDLAPLAPHLYRRLPDDAKLRRVDLRPLFQAGIRSAAQVVKPEPSPVSRRVFLLRTLAADLASAVNGGSTLDLLAHRSSAARAGLGVSIDRQLRCSVSRSPFRSRFPTCRLRPVARKSSTRSITLSGPLRPPNAET